MRILVVGWDKDEQQAFWDLIPAENKEKAVERFGKLRGDYADSVDVLDLEELKAMVARITAGTEEEDEQGYRELEADHG